MNALRKLLAPLASLRITIYCLAAAMVLVFAGTLAQKHLDTFVAQTRYFQSWIVWWEWGSGWRMPFFPGGHAIGAVLLVNLVAAFFVRFRWGWNKIGIHLIHLGLVIMLVGGLLTDLYSVSSYMPLREGQAKNYSEDEQLLELALTDHSRPGEDLVVAIPEGLLKKGGPIADKNLPFLVVVRSWYGNSNVDLLGAPGSGSVLAASNDLGAQCSVAPRPVSGDKDKPNVRSAVIEIVAKEGPSLGTWLVSEERFNPGARMTGIGRWLIPMETSPQALEIGDQAFKVDGRDWSLRLRPARYYKPFSLKLVDFSHKVYPGSMIAKDFSSHVILDDPAAHDNRPVRIYMNHPLRHGGETFYQSGTIRNTDGDISDNGTVLQVVRNPGVQMPYIACVVIAAGMLWQFLAHLARFVTRRSQSSAKRAS